MRLGIAHLTPGTRCPFCGSKLDAASGVGHDAEPEPGSLTVCCYCAGVLVFDDGGRPTRPAPGVLADVCRADPEAAEQVAKARLAVMMAIAGRRRA